MGFSLLIVLALFSFDANDPSFNSFSTEGLVNNWLGSFGSHIADLLFQLIGISAFFLCLIIFTIGSKIAGRFKNLYILPKLILTPFAILCLSLFFACLPEPSWWDFNSLGGVNGSFILAKLSNVPYFLVVIFSAISSVILISIIIEISFSDWVYFGRYVIVVTGFITDKIKHIFLRFTESNNKQIARVDDEEVEENKASEWLMESENTTLSIEEVEESPKELKKRLKNIKNKKYKKSNSAAYQIPTSDLLMDRSGENKDKKVSKDVVDNQSKMLTKVLEDFGVYGTSLGAKVGPVVTLHEFEPAPGTKASRVIGLADDIARSMSAVSARIAVVSGKTSIGIELPNPKREMIFLREMIETREYSNSAHALPIILGKDISGETMIADLAKMPHLLIAGTTGSGKSVGLNVMILSILFKMRPDECKFIMIDPKMLELSIYDGIPHLLAPVVTEPSKAIISLKWVVAEMEERYRMMSSLAVRNIAGYNEKAEKAIISGEKMSKKVQTGYDPSTGKPIIEEIEFEAKKLPFIVVIVDEMADLMLVAGKEIENSVQRLAQMARAAGIHIIMATQRPSVDVITGVIKANFPTRISFQVTSRI
ncbi:MAG: DNA translocase FtsK 4TM domain-containing protein, partial [Rickettsiales bacterium]|nr:DNA translocase FtsK 4TM domain-containing protein [Rickettsiales bacterium]